MQIGEVIGGWKTSIKDRVDSFVGRCKSAWKTVATAARDNALTRACAKIGSKNLPEVVPVQKKYIDVDYHASGRSVDISGNEAELRQFFDDYSIALFGKKVEGYLEFRESKAVNVALKSGQLELPFDDTPQWRQTPEQLTAFASARAIKVAIRKAKRRGVDVG